MYRLLGNISCDLDPKGQILYFLVNASPPKVLEVSTSNFVPELRPHDVESIRQHFV